MNSPIGQFSSSVQFSYVALYALLATDAYLCRVCLHICIITSKNV